MLATEPRIPRQTATVGSGTTISTQVLPFQAWHAAALVGTQAVVVEWRDATMEQIGVLERSGEAGTLFAGPYPVASFGVVRVWKGYGEVWLILGKRGLAYPVALVKAVKAGLRCLMEERGYHRLQASSITERGCRFLRRLGFQPEAVLSCAGPNREPMFVYGMVK